MLRHFALLSLIWSRIVGATAIAMEEFNFPKNLWRAVHRIVEFIYILGHSFGFKRHISFLFRTLKNYTFR